MSSSLEEPSQFSDLRPARTDGAPPKRLSPGTPVYTVAQLQVGVPSDVTISATLEALNPDAMHAGWDVAHERPPHKAGEQLAQCF